MHRGTFAATVRSRLRSRRLRLAAVAALSVLVTAAVVGSSSLLPRDSPGAPGATPPGPAGGCGGDIHYGIMMDAGSTGSRTHIYKFRRDAAGALKLLNEVFVAVKPGLSSFADSPADAAASIEPLMTAADSAVPAEQRPCTSMALKATAGLRLLGHGTADAILRAVLARMQRSDFRVPADGAVIMDGGDEGANAWLTVNFLLGLQFDTQGHAAAVIDMGGASTQIVFTPRSPSAWSAMPDGNLFRMTQGGREVRLYQNSYLGFGLKEAGRRIVQSAATEQSVDGRATISDFPCFPEGYAEAVNVVGGRTVTVTNAQAATQSFDRCRTLAVSLFQKSAPCRRPPCSFGGVHQPSLSLDFGGPIFAFSYYYDRMEPFLPESGVITVGDLRAAGRRVCAGSPAAGGDVYGARNKGRMCMDFAYLHALLTAGYDLPNDQHLHVKKKINDVETSWALGATLRAM